MPDTRVVVVGAGSNGLVCAINLARAGLDVTLLEHAPRPGGASSSVEATLPGFIHDHCAGFNPMTVASPAMRELELEAEGVRWVRPDAIMAHPFEDGTAIALHHDLEATVASLEGRKPGAGAAWRELIEQFRPLARDLVETILGPLPPVRRPLALGGRRCAAMPCCWPGGWLGRSRRSASMCSTARSRPTAWLAGSAQHSGLPPSTAGSGAFGFLLQLLAHSHGWPFPAGGQGQIAEALLAIAAREGVTVRCDAHVAADPGPRWAHGRRRAARRRGGIRSRRRDDDQRASRSHSLLPDEALPHRLMRRLRIWRYGTAAFKLDYALRAPVPWTARRGTRGGGGARRRRTARPRRRGGRGRPG